MSFATITTTSWSDTAQMTLSEELLQKKETLQGDFTDITQKLNSEYARTVLPLKQSADYQSLVCLWIISADSILTDIQTEIWLTQNNMLQEFVDINAEIFWLYNQYSVGLIDQSIFSTEYSILQIEVTDFYNKYTNLLQQLDQKYLQKIFNLWQDVQQYSTQNDELLSNIHKKIVLIQNTVDTFSIAEQWILEMNNWLWINQNTFFKTLETMRAKAINELKIDQENHKVLMLRKYPNFQNFEYIIDKKKADILTLYKADLDQKIKNIFWERYDRDEYLQLKEQANILKSNFYNNNELSCNKILWTDLDLDTYGEGLNEQITEFVQNLEKGLVFIQNETQTWTSLKDEIMSSFQNFYTTRYQQDMNTLRNFTEEQAQLRLKSNPQLSTKPTETNHKKYPEWFSFNRSFTKGEKSDDIKVLQYLLTDLGLYNDAIDWVYWPLTSSAVYEFQKKNLDASLLINPLSHGYVGPSTQKALNQSLESIQIQIIPKETTKPEIKPTTFIPKTQEDLILTYLYKIGKKFSSQDSYKSMLNNSFTIIDEKLKSISLTVKQRLFILDLKWAVYRYLEDN